MMIYGVVNKYYIGGKKKNYNTFIENNVHDVKIT